MWMVRRLKIKKEKRRWRRENERVSEREAIPKEQTWIGASFNRKRETKQQKQQQE